MFVQPWPFGSNLTWPKPFAALAVIEPTWPEVTSLTTTLNPSNVSYMPTTSWSPDRMNRSVFGFGVYVDSVALTGLAGACERPFLVMNAKLTGSNVTWSRQVSLFSAPVFMSSERLSMLRAAHQRVASQLSPGGHCTQPGG